MIARVLMAAVVAMVTTAGASAIDDTPPRTVSVSGEGMALVAPDMASVVFGVESRAENIGEVNTRTRETIAGIIKAVVALGIEESDIETQQSTIDPLYSDEDPTERKGFRATNFLFVQLKDLKQLEPLIETAVDNGANTIDGLVFDIRDKKKHIELATGEALKEARERARRMAAAYGQIIGLPLTIKEGYVNSYRRSGGPAGRSIFQGGGGSAETILRGMIEVRASVQVTFELRSPDTEEK